MHTPRNIEIQTKTERSLFFITAIMPVIKATMLVGNKTATATSHQWSLKLKTFKTKTNPQETPTAIKKKTFSPTDHLPNLVFGIKFVFIIKID